MNRQNKTRGRGAQSNPSSRFAHIVREPHNREESEEEAKTKFYVDHPKTVVNKVSSPDLHFDWSINPYQGCEHGCSYCYARNTHEYYEWSPGLDFERKIVVKENVAQLLEKHLLQKSWSASPIMLSGNTDCYQPAEQKYKLTRSLLEVFVHYQHPVSIITKNDLILRDIDLLEQLASQDLVRVAISITTLDDTLKRLMEPRTSSGKKRLSAIKTLSDAGIPAGVMMAPIIPGLTDGEIFDIAERSSDNGALFFHHSIVRLNGALPEIFSEWIRQAYPQKADRVLSQIASCHGGKLGNTVFGERQKGSGALAHIIGNQLKIARSKYFKNREVPEFNLDAFNYRHGRQLSLDL